MISGEATNTNFKVFGLTRLGLESTIYRTQDEHANHYTTDAVNSKYITNQMKMCKLFIISYFFACLVYFVIVSSLDVHIYRLHYTLGTHLHSNIVTFFLDFEFFDMEYNVHLYYLP